MFKEHETFVLTKELYDKSVPVGTVGVVLLVFSDYANDQKYYEVEFPDKHGGNLGNKISYTIREDAMKKR